MACSPEDGMMGALGDRTKKKSMSPSEMRAYIESVPDGIAQSYDDAGRVVAQAMLRFVAAHLPDPRALQFMGAMEFGDLWKATDPRGYREALEERAQGATGFQFGWAYNAVRYVAELPPVGNPAIIEVASS